MDLNEQDIEAMDNSDGNLSEIHVVPLGKEWKVWLIKRHGILIEPELLSTRHKKSHALSDGIEFAKGAVYQPTTLKIHDRWGKFQEERTYPRLRDPRKSKG